MYVRKFAMVTPSRFLYTQKKIVKIAMQVVILEFL